MIGYNINYPVVLKNVLPTDKIYNIYKEIEYDWVLKNGSDSNNYYDKVTWGKTIDDELSISNIEASTYINLKIQKILKTKLRLCKIHINGQTSNQLTNFHIDFDYSDIWTFVLFTSLEWNTSWGGEFVVLNPVTKEYKYIPYVPNTGCLIPSNWLHVGNSPNGFTDKLRTSIAFSYCMFSRYNSYKTKYNFNI